MTTKKHAGGRPPKYKSSKELEAKIEDYFKNPPHTRPIYNKEGEKVADIPVLTITGLVLHCGFCNRSSFYDLERVPKFSHTIKKARTLIEIEYEKLLQSGLGAGAIFALKNFGWKDQSDFNIGGQKDNPVKIIDYTTLSKEDIARLIDDELKT